jgi:hypothetical protein
MIEAKMAKKEKEWIPFTELERGAYLVERSHLYALCVANNFFGIKKGFLGAQEIYWIEDPTGDRFDASGWSDADFAMHGAGVMVSRATLLEEIDAGNLLGFEALEFERIHQDVMTQMKTGGLPF